MGNGSHRIDKTDDLIKALVVIPLGSRPSRIGGRGAMWRVLNKRCAAGGRLGNGMAALVRAPATIALATPATAGRLKRTAVSKIEFRRELDRVSVRCPKTRDPSLGLELSQELLPKVHPVTKANPVHDDLELRKESLDPLIFSREVTTDMPHFQRSKWPYRSRPEAFPPPATPGLQL